MGRKYVRQAIAAYLQSPQIVGVGTVYASPPKISRSSDAYKDLPSGVPSGAVIYVEVLQITEKRLADGGPTSGTKETRHNIRLHLLFRSRQGKAEDAMDDHDDQLDTLMERLRADRTLGTNGRILQTGQDVGGYVAATGLPKESGTGSTHIWTLLQFDAVEVITA
jgi:hypothetical protein